MTSQPHTTPPDTAPARLTFQERAGKIETLGWSAREAEWIALVALHSGVFTRSQYGAYFNDPHREMARLFVRALIEKKAGAEDERAMFPGGVGLIRFGGHLPKGEYDVDHDGHEGQADAAELHG